MNLVKTVQIGSVEIGSGVPKICVPITGTTKEEILHQAKNIKKAEPDLVEWRCDLFAEVFSSDAVMQVLEELHRILEEIPILFTFRSKREGGGQDISIKDYIVLNVQAAKSPYVSLVDVEICMGDMKPLIQLLKEQGKAVIGSHHRFDCTPEKDEMVEMLVRIENAGADILKLAVMPHTALDVELLLQATNEAVCIKVNHPVITMSMGRLGVKSRICGQIYGSSVTFACVGEASAPGQIEIEALRDAMRRIM